MMPTPNPNQLVVEGTEDLYAVASLMGKWVEWDKDKKKAPVYIDAVGGVDKILDRTNIRVRLKSSGLKRLGFIIDADSSCQSRWDSLKGHLTACGVQDLPDAIPSAGLVKTTSYGLKIGAWIMPDNGSKGMLESLLLQLVPDDRLPLYEYSVECTTKAKTYPHTFLDVHTDKAIVHSWLAWQDPPGLALGNAVLNSMIDGRNPNTKKFVDWFINLYDLKLIRQHS